MSIVEPQDPQPIAGDVPPAEPLPAPADPFQALDNLMVVVEALCPRWPQRPPLLHTSLNKL